MKKYLLIGISVFIGFFLIIAFAMQTDGSDVILYGLGIIATINAVLLTMIVDELKKINKK